MGWVADIIEDYMQENEYNKASRIEYWYDKHTRLWVVEVLDNRGYEIDYGSYADTTHQIPKDSLDIEILDYMTEYSINPLNVLHWSNGKKINHRKWYQMWKEIA